MEEDFVTYDQAVRLKELGFNWKCNHTYDNATQKRHEHTEDDYYVSPYHDFNNETYGVPLGHISAPTLSLAQKWLRETKNLIVETNVVAYVSNQYRPRLVRKGVDEYHIDYPLEETYDKALETGITKALEIIQKEEKDGPQIPETN